MAVHVRLQGAGPREPLVADLALVLLLGARGNLGAELAHQGLWRRGDLARHEVLRSRKRPRPRKVHVGGAHGRVVANWLLVGPEVAVGGYRRARRMRRREPVRIGRPSRTPRAVDVPRRLLVHRHQAVAGIHGLRVTTPLVVVDVSASTCQLQTDQCWKGRH